MAEIDDKPVRPQHASCTKCGHVWQICTTPIEIGIFSRLLKATVCPMCNATSKFLFLEETPDITLTVKVAVNG